MLHGVPEVLHAVRLHAVQLRAGCLEVPFNTMPPEGALPTLPVYLTYRSAGHTAALLRQQLCGVEQQGTSCTFSTQQ